MIDSESQENKRSSDFPKKLVVGDRYEILSEIGSGGLSTVYIAKDTVLKRSIAVKLLKPQSSAEYVIRLQREAKAICLLKHQNIIEVYDFFMADGNVPVLAMEFIKGESLDDYIKRKGPMAMPVAYDVFQQICDAIAYAHSRHILHRDLKPGNVLLRELANGKLEVKIIDFGIAKQLDSEEGALTTSGAVLGTPSFISPEQGQGHTVDHRSDIYSLGCLMYKCLTGKAPFRGRTALDVVSAQVSEKAPSLREGNPTIAFPDEIERVVATAMEKDPEDRFQSMDEVAVSIKALIVADGGLSLVDNDDDETKRKLVSWSLLSAVVLFLVFAGSIVYFIFQYDNTFEIEKAKGDKLFDIRQSHNITTRYVQKWLWHDIEGSVTNKRLSALSQLDVQRLDLSSSSITDEQLTYLLDLPILALDLRGTNISDKGIETILRMRGLQTLLLERCPRITYKGYRLLGNLKSLKILSLRDSNVSDEDLKDISRLSGLQLLYVSNSPNITDAAIDQIMKLEKLVSVRIGSTKVTRQGIEKFENHPELIFLGLDDLHLTDDKMPPFFSEKISMLDLSSNPLTYKGLAGVLALHGLWYLDLRECPNISTSADARLSSRFRVQEGRVILTDGPARGAFSDTKDEFYFDPEYYKPTSSRTSVEFRKHLILETIQGPELD